MGELHVTLVVLTWDRAGAIVVGGVRVVIGCRWVGASSDFIIVADAVVIRVRASGGTFSNDADIIDPDLVPTKAEGVDIADQGHHIGVCHERTVGSRFWCSCDLNGPDRGSVGSPDARPVQRQEVIEVF